MLGKIICETLIHAHVVWREHDAGSKMVNIVLYQILWHTRSEVLAEVG
jgi:hypothetical protein